MRILFVVTERSGADIRALFKSRIFAERIFVLENVSRSGADFHHASRSKAERISALDLLHGFGRIGYPLSGFVTERCGLSIRSVKTLTRGADLTPYTSLKFSSCLYKWRRQQDAPTVRCAFLHTSEHQVTLPPSRAKLRVTDSGIAN